MTWLSEYYFLGSPSLVIAFLSPLKLASDSPVLGLFLISMLTHQRRQWHPTPVLLPGRSHGRRRLHSMGLLRVRHDWATSLSLFTFMHWRRNWQPTPVFLPGESQGWRAWWAAVYGISQSWTRLKWFSSSSMLTHFLGGLIHVTALRSSIYWKFLNWCFLFIEKKDFFYEFEGMKKL